jgi:hypothetical protein
VTRIAGIDCYVEFNSSVDPRWNVPPAHTVVTDAA